MRTADLSRVHASQRPESCSGIFLPEAAILVVLCTHLIKEIQSVLIDFYVQYPKIALGRMEVANLATHPMSFVAPEETKHCSHQITQVGGWAW